MYSLLLLSTDLKTWLEFISSIASSLAWPIAIIIVCSIFKKHIVQLLPFLKNIKYKEFSFEFDHSVKDLQEKMDKVVPEQEKSDNSFLINEDLKINGLLEPDLIIIYSWREVEIKLKEKYLTLFPYNVKYANSTNKILYELTSNGLIEKNIYNLFKETIQLRNKVVHTKNNDLTIENAIDYSKVCNELLFIINNLGENSK